MPPPFSAGYALGVRDAGQSRYDRGLTAPVKARINSYEPHLDVTYLNDHPMAGLRERLRHLPSHPIVLYLSFFKDTLGQSFLNATEALPLIAAASSAPVFGIKMTKRLRDVVQLFAEGRPIKEIAAVLNLSEKMAEFHKRHIMEGFNLKSNADLVLLGLKHGLIAVDPEPQPRALAS
jgi:DNA-binding CsgD family transcriptional regulator